MPGPSDQTDGLRKKRQRGGVYGRRKGPKLSAHQAALFESLLPALNLKPQAGIDPRQYFAAPVGDVWLEIGFGAGEHLLWQAEHHPEIGFIGAEPYQAGVAKLLSKLDSLSASANILPRVFAGEGDREAVEGAICAGQRPPPPIRGTSPTLRAGEEKPTDYVSRIRVYEGDARDVIEALPDASLGRVFLLFPDPWPKTRHHKRRFVQMEMLDELARVMKSGAEFRFASDDSGYVDWALERVLLHPDFEWMAARSEDWRRRTHDWPPTRYEQKALHGVPVFLRFRRVPAVHGSALQTDATKRK